METLLSILDWPMQKPPLYGFYHLMWLVIPFVAAWLLCRWYKRSRRPERHIRRVVLHTAMLVALLEVLKQINFDLVWEDDDLKWDMHWYAFPFQFCSTPMYAGLLTGVFKKGRIHDSLCAFLATYAVFAGLCVMLYPVTVFTGTLLINVQTMVCHASMLTIGIYLFYTGHVKLEHRTILKAMPVFGICVANAMLLNEAAYRSGLLAAGHSFNMFFISPYCEPERQYIPWCRRRCPIPGAW